MCAAKHGRNNIALIKHVLSLSLSMTDTVVRQNLMKLAKNYYKRDITTADIW